MALVILASTVVEAAFEPAIRYSFKYLIDGAIVPQDGGALLAILGALGAGVIVYSALCVLGDLLWARFGTCVINDIRQKLHDHVMLLSPAFFSRRSTGDVLSCFLADGTAIEMSLVSAVPYALMGASSVIFSGALLVSLHWPLALVNLAGLALCFGVPRLLMGRAVARGFALRQQEGAIAARLQENLCAHTIVTMFGLERHLSRNLAKELRDLLRLAMRANFLSYFIQRIPNVLFLLLALVVLGLGASLTYSGGMSLGTLVSYQVLSLGLSTSIANLTWITPSVVDAQAAFVRINALLAEVPSVRDAPGARDLPPFARAITFESVSLSYDGTRPALADVSFEIPRGAFVVVVGPSGSGKSSVITLLSRLADPDAGRVCVDGHDLRHIAQRSLRAQIGLVSQEVVLFDTTFRDNICYGRLDASQAQIAEAAQQAEIHAFISSLPQGYETRVGESGDRMSAGQRQRVALARALVRDPAIVILDEGTSALDPLTEAEIFATVRKLAGMRTILAVTHRLHMARFADLVLVMNDGRVVASGTHEALIEESGLYAQLWRAGDPA